MMQIIKVNLVIEIVSPGYVCLRQCSVLNVVEVGSTGTEQGTRVSRTVGL